MKQPLFTVCILAIFVRSVFCKSVPSCAPGQIQYETVCCVPIETPNFCGLHFRVQRCTEDGEPDTCVKCERGLVKFSNSTSRTEDNRCYRPQGCPEEARLSSSKIGQCECDQSRCYYGDQFECRHFRSKCKENTYHKNGACVPCPEGTHRPGVGCGPCQLMSSLASSVNNISVPHPNSAKSPSTVPTKSPTPGLTVTKKDNVPEVDEEVEAGSLPGFPTWATVLITLVALILIAIITILGSMWWFRRLRTNETGPTRMPSNSSISRDSTDSGGGHPSTQPPPYSQINHTSGSQDQPCPNNENTGYCNGGTPERCPNQRARPFQNCRYDTPSEHPINYASLSFEPGQQSSTSSFHLSSNGFSSGSSGPLDRVSVPGQAPDQTDKKVAAGGRESAGENQRVVTKPPSGVVPVGEEEEEEEAALLRSAPSLDPDSIKDSQ